MVRGRRGRSEAARAIAMISLAATAGMRSMRKLWPLSVIQTKSEKRRGHGDRMVARAIPITLERARDYTEVNRMGGRKLRS
jgi:hypothetical protein